MRLEAADSVQPADEAAGSAGDSGHMGSVVCRKQSHVSTRVQSNCSLEADRLILGAISIIVGGINNLKGMKGKLDLYKHIG